MCINSGSKSYICGLFSIFPNISNFNYRINWPCDYWLIVIKSLCAVPMLRLFVLISEIPWDKHAWINDIILFVIVNETHGNIRYYLVKIRIIFKNVDCSQLPNNYLNLISIKDEKNVLCLSHILISIIVSLAKYEIIRHNIFIQIRWSIFLLLYVLVAVIKISLH